MTGLIEIFNISWIAVLVFETVILDMKIKNNKLIKQKLTHDFLSAEAALQRCS